MQIAVFAIAAAALFVASRTKKKKPKESAKPQVEMFGRVERLLNAAAIRESLSSVIPPPMILYGYVKEGAALDRMTKIMFGQAAVFQNIEFYQMRISDIRKVVGMKGGPPKGIAGILVGVHSEDAVWKTEIFPNDDIEDMSSKVVQRIVYASTGHMPKIKES
jgi:hypothetical protein